MKSVHNAVRHAYKHHKVLAVLIFIALWYVATEVLHYELTGHFIEALGIAPAIDRAFGGVLGD